MPSIAIQEAFVAISAATAAGVLTVASTDYLFPGALAWVALDNGTSSARVKILARLSSTQIRVRRFPNDNEGRPDNASYVPPGYGVSDMTAFATAAHICQEAQTVPVDPAFSVRVVA